ncbi:DEAD/DEAH box helicase [Winogradskyella thalassocola]|uniref:Superfamily II DNA and RNA helicase n=1 Tax=Winogradskyella thalassocola TaxID=262004 RepID=A0A1G8E2P6_9FLAO|nr:DEAD/DEAH box helicase [Winogradskyella thalassocola]SDH64252.1 Superfamily II DNA and RNA helicase [Winogradskyella thalassocola]
MANNIKAQQDILEKLNIYQLNPMQESALASIEANDKTILLSPTGTGKTLAFLLPLLETLDPECEDVQALIIVPSRELAIQIETVIRNMGSGYKANAIYGGRAISKDKIELKHTPAILIGTPGRLADHFEQARFTTKFIKTLVIDEFDISIEVGAGGEMKDIMSYLANVNKRILTSATQGASIPKYLKMDGAKTLNFLTEKPSSKLEIKTVVSPSANKHNTLVDLLHHVGNEPGIVFCNKKERLEDLSRFLDKKNIAHTCFYGGMEQHDRERALIKLRNGSVSILVASDLASRGIDIPEMSYIIHYEIPDAYQEYTHRNGRTARVNSKGTAYLIKGDREVFPEFIEKSKIIRVNTAKDIKPPFWTTLFISGGRKDKISKGDIAGLFFKQGNISKDQLGVIELKQDCAFVGVPVSIADSLVDQLNNTRLKKKKVRVTII